MLPLRTRHSEAGVAPLRGVRPRQGPGLSCPSPGAQPSLSCPRSSTELGTPTELIDGWETNASRNNVSKALQGARGLGAPFLEGASPLL